VVALSSVELKDFRIPEHDFRRPRSKERNDFFFLEVFSREIPWEEGNLFSRGFFREGDFAKKKSRNACEKNYQVRMGFMF